jgi:hypothetical protein
MSTAAASAAGSGGEQHQDNPILSMPSVPVDAGNFFLPGLNIGEPPAANSSMGEEPTAASKKHAKYASALKLMRAVWVLFSSTSTHVPLDIWVASDNHISVCIEWEHPSGHVSHRKALMQKKFVSAYPEDAYSLTNRVSGTDAVSDAIAEHIRLYRLPQSLGTGTFNRTRWSVSNQRALEILGQMAHWRAEMNGVHNYKFSAVVQPTARKTIQIEECWGDWNPRVASKHFSAEDLKAAVQASRIPDESVLNDLECVKIAIALTSYTHEASDVFYSHGPSSSVRMLRWMQDDCVRRIIARHLVDECNILVDMANDPVCPWKGMFFYKGCDDPNLQNQLYDPTSITQNSHSSITHQPCKLDWVTPRYQNPHKTLTGFTTPYPYKAIGYGDHMYTYKLAVRGTSLRMVDMRGDYRTDTRGYAGLDGFAWIHALAGIPYRTARGHRTETVEVIQKLLTGVADGVILDGDIEWAWFDPPTVLEWVAPETNRYTRLWLNQEELDEGSVCTKIFTQLKADLEPGKVMSVMQEIGQKVRVEGHGLPITRYRGDHDYGQASFVPTSAAQSRQLPRAWVTTRYSHASPHGGSGVYLVNYEQFWKRVCPDLSGVSIAGKFKPGVLARYTSRFIEDFAASSVANDDTDRKHLALVLFLESLLNYEMPDEWDGERVIFKLPSGFSMLVGRMKPFYDERDYGTLANPFPHHTAPPGSHFPTVIVKVTHSGSKRAADSPAEADLRDAKLQHTSGKHGRTLPSTAPKVEFLRLIL